MNPKWLSVASFFLRLASAEFSNHGCNDWQWPADWTAEERLAFADAMVRDNVRKPVGVLTAAEEEQVQMYARGEFGPPDWWVMAFLADQMAPGDEL